MRKILDFANVTASLLTGMYLTLLAAFGSESLLAVPDWLSSSGAWFPTLLVGLFLAGGNIQALFHEWRIGGLRRNLRVSTIQGMTELSVTALEMLLTRDLKAEADIVDPKVTLTPRGEGRPMLCEVELRLQRQENVIARMDVIRLMTRSAIDKLIPSGITVDVRVEAKDFVNGASGPARPGEGGEFKGPVYSDPGRGEA